MKRETQIRPSLQNLYLQSRILGACNDRDDQKSNDVRERSSSLSVQAADLVVASAPYHKGCYSRFVNGRVPAGLAQKIKTKSPSVNDPLLSPQYELQFNLFAIWDSIKLLEHYPELGGQAMWRSALISMVSQDMDALVILSAPSPWSFFFLRDSTKILWKIMKE